MRGLFFGNQLLAQVGLSSQFVTFGKFLYKRGLWQLLQLFTSIYELDTTLTSNEWLYFRAVAAMQTGNYGEAKKHFAELMNRLPEDDKVAHGYVETCIRSHDFVQAEQVLERLQGKGNISPEQELFLAKGYARTGKAEKAIELLFKLNYEHPDNMEVKRQLALTQLQEGRAETAIDLLNSIVYNNNEVDAKDMLYLAAAQWLGNNTQKAIELFVNFLKKTGEKPSETCSGIDEILHLLDSMAEKYERSAIDIRILTDIVADEMEVNNSPNINND